MTTENIIEATKPQDVMAPHVEGETSPEHVAWIISQTKETLAKKAAGKMPFRSLDDVMRKFGFDAR